MRTGEGCGPAWHAQLLAAEDVTEFAELGVAASVQFSHAPWDRGHRRPTLGRHDRPRLRLPVSCSSPAPCSPTARTRRSRNSIRSPESERACCEHSTSAQAGTRSRPSRSSKLEATTINPAWLAGDERRRGKLVPGYLADLVVLDRDLLSCASKSYGSPSRRHDAGRPLGLQPTPLGLVPVPGTRTWRRDNAHSATVADVRANAASGTCRGARHQDLGQSERAGLAQAQERHEAAEIDDSESRQLVATAALPRRAPRPRISASSRATFSSREAGRSR